MFFHPNTGSPGWAGSKVGDSWGNITTFTVWQMSCTWPSSCCVPHSASASLLLLQRGGQSGQLAPCTGDCHPHPLQLHPAPCSHFHKTVPFDVPSMRGLPHCWRARAALLPSCMLRRLPWHILWHLRHKGSRSFFASPKCAPLYPRTPALIASHKWWGQVTGILSLGFAQHSNPFSTSFPSSHGRGAGDAQRKADTRAHRAPRASCPFVSCFLPHGPTAAIISSGLSGRSHGFTPRGIAHQQRSLLCPGKGVQGRPRGAEDGEKRVLKWSWWPKEPARANPGLSPSLWLHHWGVRVGTLGLLPGCALPQRLLELRPALLDISVLGGDLGCQAGLQAEELGHGHVQHLEEREAGEQ